MDVSMESGGESNSKINITRDNDSSIKKRDHTEVQYLPRKKLLTKKSQGSHRDRPYSNAHHKHHQNPNQQNTGEAVVLVNPGTPKILPSHTALEDSTSRSIMPETATYPSLMQTGPSGGSFVFPETFNLAASMGFAAASMPVNYPILPPIDADELDSDQYQEIMQGLLQAIHNQNRIMEECRNILTSIHRAIVPFQPIPVTMVPAPSSPPQLPLNLSNSGQTTSRDLTPTDKNSTAANLESTCAKGETMVTPTTPLSTLGNTTNVALNLNSFKNCNLSTFQDQPVTPASKTTQTNQQQNKEPEKPAVFGPDGEFSSAYLRYVHGKSSTATSFANVLMKEVFTLEERISSNCNGVMGKKALEPNRLDKIKRAVKRFYTDTEEEFQDMWKKCRKSIDSTNRNLKFVIMKKPNA